MIDDVNESFMQKLSSMKVQLKKIVSVNLKSKLLKRQLRLKYSRTTAYHRNYQKMCIFLTLIKE